MSEHAVKKTLRCPTCKQPVGATNPEFPFCSERCRVIDLGKWASGEYRIASPIFDEELLEALEKHPSHTRMSGHEDEDVN